ncbi:MAG: hypothetical protein IKY64_09695 [Bacteroidaceae bacterium]|nr:hypothetical protein [Bacteroidaceae bacterium]
MVIPIVSVGIGAYGNKTPLKNHFATFVLELYDSPSIFIGDCSLIQGRGGIVCGGEGRSGD